MTDYIKKSDAIEAITNYRPYASTYITLAEYKREYERYKNIISEIEKITPSDIAPIVHGHWIQLSNDDEDCNTFICSTCKHEIFHVTDVVYVEPLPKYCEECGTKMDERGTNE